MAREACMVLEDGSVYRGECFGAEVPADGEVVFNTSMTGYQEVLTDPSYAGQIVVLTYPIVGNYGINASDFESKQIQVAGFVVREHCDYPSHGQSTSTLHEFLVAQGIPGIKGVDTRSVTRRLRNSGVMMGSICPGSSKSLQGVQAPTSAEGEMVAEEALARIRKAPKYDDVDFVGRVTTAQSYTWDQDGSGSGSASKGLILVADYGLKYNILRLLKRRGYDVMAVPATATAKDMLALGPAGIVLSPGPGDPALLEYIVSEVTALVGKLPIMGICLGHQMVARALGAGTYKLKFGHRGANHPVKDLDTGRVYITSQNHGYAVDGDSLPPGLEVTHVNLNDGTVEGLRHRELPVLTFQYHSEASPGPRDNEYLFDQFLGMPERSSP